MHILLALPNEAFVLPVGVIKTLIHYGNSIMLGSNTDNQTDGSYLSSNDPHSLNPLNLNRIWPLQRIQTLTKTTLLKFLTQQRMKKQNHRKILLCAGLEDKSPKELLILPYTSKNTADLNQVSVPYCCFFFFQRKVDFSVSLLLSYYAFWGVSGKAMQ